MKNTELHRATTQEQLVNAAHKATGVKKEDCVKHIMEHYISVFR